MKKTERYRNWSGPGPHVQTARRMRHRSATCEWGVGAWCGSENRSAGETREWVLAWWEFELYKLEEHV
jgi:hypothetical protein